MGYFIVYYLFSFWLNTAIFKAEIPNRLYNLIPTNFIDKLTDCNFCMMTWLNFCYCLMAFFFIEPSTGMRETILFELFGDYYFLSFAPLSVALSQLINNSYK